MQVGGGWTNVFTVSNNYVILRSKGVRGVEKGLKITVILKESPQMKDYFHEFGMELKLGVMNV